MGTVISVFTKKKYHPVYFRMLHCIHHSATKPIFLTCVFFMCTLVKKIAKRWDVKNCVGIKMKKIQWSIRILLYYKGWYNLVCKKQIWYHLSITHLCKLIFFYFIVTNILKMFKKFVKNISRGLEIKSIEVVRKRLR